MDHTLLLLGLLSLQEMHGYQLSDLIDRRLSYLTELKKPTLYHLLGRLEAAGDVVKSVSRSGNRPERYTYRLTRAGKTHFARRLSENLQAAHQAYFADDIGLLFLSEMAPSQVRKALKGKQSEVDAQRILIEHAVAKHQPDTPAYYILRHHLLHLQTEQAWLRELQSRLKQRPVKGDILQCLEEPDPGPRTPVSATRKSQIRGSLT